MSIDGDLYLNTVHWGGTYYPVPYESGIAGGLGTDKSLHIFATPEKKGKRFNINLLKRNGDICFHFNCRFDEKAVIRNSLQAGEWGNEEREGKVPFEKGIGFDLVIQNEPYAFQVWVNGERIDQLTEAEMMPVRADLGMIFQEGALFDSLTVRENVGYKLYEESETPIPEIDDRVKEVLGFVGLIEHLQKMPSELSGGQRNKR